MIEALWLAGALLAAAGLTTLHLRLVRERAVAWDEAGRLLGLPAGSGTADVWGGASLTGEVDGLGLEIQALRGEKNPRRLRLVVDGRGRIPHRIVLRSENLASAIAKSLGEHDVETGDEDFDRAVLVEGNPVLLSALLDVDTRRRLRWLVGVGLRVEGGRVVLGHDAYTDDSRSLASRATELLELAGRLVEPPGLVNLLAHNACQDPLRGVRWLCFQRLIERFPRHEATLATARELLRDANREVQLAAARHLGEEGIPTLMELTDLAGSDDYLAAMAVAALGAKLPLERATRLLEVAYARRSMGLAGAVVEALGATGSATAASWLTQILRGGNGELAMLAARALGTNIKLAAEPALCAVLSHPEPERRLAAAEALGSVGTTASIPLLRALSEAGASNHELRQAAVAAIAAIQERLTGAAPGQLAVADREAGELALASGSNGDLSLADARPTPEVET
ncbi:MAG: HEAT repeat domain-containing protein [Thermoanaerobaculaceae bacterium]|jgi:HEAT repeat protein|nr:HEAT repeat domain-containing protein [Thermoanaerobaculaceae bacterium]